MAGGRILGAVSLLILGSDGIIEALGEGPVGLVVGECRIPFW